MRYKKLRQHRQRRLAVGTAEWSRCNIRRRAKQGNSASLRDSFGMRTCVCFANQSEFEYLLSKQKMRGDASHFCFDGRGDKIRTCDFYVPNVALYQAEPHLVIKFFFAPRALPVVTKPLSSSLSTRQSASHCHSFLFASSATGGAHKRPQAEPHLVIKFFFAPRALPVVTKPLS